MTDYCSDEKEAEINQIKCEYSLLNPLGGFLSGLCNGNLRPDEKIEEIKELPEEFKNEYL